jgi:Ca2+-transporting ATPase
VTRLLLDAALCSDAALHQHAGHWTIAGDPTEGALVVAAEKAGVSVEQARRRYARLDAIPFESENQFMAVLHRTPEGDRRVIIKGAPEVVLHRCGDGTDGVDHAAMHADVDRMASRGMRVLALAEKSGNGIGEELHLDGVAAGLGVLGLIGMIDPPRQVAVEAVRACQAAGIRVKMITGDHRATAQAIGRELGLANEGAAVAGAALDGLPPEHLRTLAGTSVSKEAADVVLTDDNFATIVAAVEEGRRVYDNLIKSLAFVLPSNLGLALILIYAVQLFPFDPHNRLLLLPIEPTQILWINLVAAVALALPLAFEAKEADVMSRPPRDPRAPVLSRFVVWRTVVVALLMTAGAVGVFQWAYGHYLETGAPQPVALAEAQTMAVTTVIMFQIFYLQQSRSLRDPPVADGSAQQPDGLPRGRHRPAGAGRIHLSAPIADRVRERAPVLDRPRHCDPRCSPDRARGHAGETAAPARRLRPLRLRRMWGPGP